MQDIVCTDQLCLTEVTSFLVQPRLPRGGQPGVRGLAQVDKVQTS